MGVTVTHITDEADPRVEPFRAIRERDLVGRQGRFIAEGRLVVRTLLASSRARAITILVSPKALDSIADALEATAQEPEVLVAPTEVMSAIAGFDIHRGCLALGERPDPPTAGELAEAPSPSLVVACEDLSNHDNMGGVFRSAAAFGASGVLLSPRCCDPLYRKAIRVSMGTALELPFARSMSWSQDLALFREREYRVLALALTEDALTIAEAAGGETSRVALVVGAEGPGLARSTIAACDAAVRIPITRGVDSLNAAVATSIALQRLSEGHLCWDSAPLPSDGR